jgi:hypothetical protein
MSENGELPSSDHSFLTFSFILPFLCSLPSLFHIRMIPLLSGISRLLTLILKWGNKNLTEAVHTLLGWVSPYNNLVTLLQGSTPLPSAFMPCA